MRTTIQRTAVVSGLLALVSVVVATGAHPGGSPGSPARASAQADLEPLGVATENRPAAITLPLTRDALYLAGLLTNSAGNSDFATVKYDKTGRLLWTKRYNGPMSKRDTAEALAVDKSGNVYVTGSSQSGPNTFDTTTVKYGASGAQLWAKRYNGPYRGSSSPVGVAIDGSGNAYVTGDMQSGASQYDYATVKYTPAGALAWAKAFRRAGSAYNFPRWLGYQGTSVFVGGSSNTARGADFTVLKYTTTGTLSWVRYADSGRGSDYLTSAATDRKGNVVATGASGGGGFLTVKYDNAGRLVWTRTYKVGANDAGRAVAVDDAGNAYVTGVSQGSGTGEDFATIKYDSSGRQTWVQRFNRSGASQDRPTGIAVDPVVGFVYVVGQSRLSTNANFDFATIKYDSTGKRSWVSYYK